MNWFFILLTTEFVSSSFSGFRLICLGKLSNLSSIYVSIKHRKFLLFYSWAEKFPGNSGASKDDTPSVVEFCHTALLSLSLAQSSLNSMSQKPCRFSGWLSLIRSHFLYYFFFLHFLYWLIWTELIVAKIENWKHCSKIIFKCVNSTVRSIFNISKYVNSMSLFELNLLLLKLKTM